MVERDDGDAPAILRGRVTDVAGRPVPGATLDVSQNASSRLYAIQDPEQPTFNLRGEYTTDADRRYEIRTIRRFRTRSPTTGPSARCSRRPGAIRGGPRTSTCW